MILILYMYIYVCIAPWLPSYNMDTKFPGHSSHKSSHYKCIQLKSNWPSKWCSLSSARLHLHLPQLTFTPKLLAVWWARRHHFQPQQAKPSAIRKFAKLSVPLPQGTANHSLSRELLSLLPYMAHTHTHRNYTDGSDRPYIKERVLQLSTPSICIANISQLWDYLKWLLIMVKSIYVCILL